MKRAFANMYPRTIMQINHFCKHAVCVTRDELTTVYGASSSSPIPLPQQASESNNCFKACWSWCKPANEASVQPTLSTTIWLMSCQSLSRGWPSPKPMRPSIFPGVDTQLFPVVKTWSPSDGFS